MHICVGVSHGGLAQFEMTFTLAIIAYYQGKAGYDFNIVAKESCLVGDNANEIIEAVKNIPLKCDWFFMIDWDLHFYGTGDVLGEMIAKDKDVLCGAYYQGAYPYRPVVYNFMEDGLLVNVIETPKGLLRTDAAGAGWMLIKGKVLDLFTPELEEKMGKPFDPVMKGMTPHLRADAAFFWRLKQMGVEVWVDGDIKLAHVKKQLVTSQFFDKSKIIIENRKNGKCETLTP